MFVIDNCFMINMLLIRIIVNLDGHYLKFVSKRFLES